MRKRPFSLQGWAEALLSERVPYSYGPGPQVAEETRFVAEKFCVEDPWAVSKQGASAVDVEELCSRVVSYARSLGYDVLDEPGSPYARVVPERLGLWKPSRGRP